MVISCMCFINGMKSGVILIYTLEIPHSQEGGE